MQVVVQHVLPVSILLVLALEVVQTVPLAHILLLVRQFVAIVQPVNFLARLVRLLRALV